MKTLDDQVGRSVGSEEGFLKHMARTRRIQGKFISTALCNLVVPEQISRDLAHYIRDRRGYAEGHTIIVIIATASLELGHRKT